MQTSQSEIIMQVRSFVQENFLYMHSNFKLGDDDRLLEKGVIDSMSIVEMISFIEREFGVNAMEEDISDANFGSLAGIARFVSERQVCRRGLAHPGELIPALYSVDETSPLRALQPEPGGNGAASR